MAGRAGNLQTKSEKPKAAKSVKKTAKKTGKTTEKAPASSEKKRASTKKAPVKTSKTAKAEPKKDSTAAVTEKRRKQLIKNEIRRLNGTFTEVESEKKRLVKATIEDAAFLTVTMAELRAKIQEEGTEIRYQNGENQWGTKQSPAVLTYLQMSNKLVAAMKILLDCQPKQEVKETDDRFDSFIEQRGDD